MAVAGQRITADLFNSLAEEGTYTPELVVVSGTDPNLGADGAASGRWHRNGNLITVQMEFLFSGTGVSAGSGSYKAVLPFLGQSTWDTASGPVVGTAYLQDDSTSANRAVAAVTLFQQDGVLIRPDGIAFVTSSSPFTWADGDRINLFATYLADADSLS